MEGWEAQSRVHGVIPSALKMLQGVPTPVGSLVRQDTPEWIIKLLGDQMVPARP